jgi:hypothetical protein
MDATRPIREARNETQILAHVLFADQPNRYDTSGRDRDGGAEKALQHENAFGVVSQRPMSKIRGDRLGLVEPLMQREIVFCSATPFSD